MKLLTIAQVTKWTLSLGDQRHKWGQNLDEPKLSQPNGYCGFVFICRVYKSEQSEVSVQPKRPSDTFAQCLLKRNVRLRNSYLENS
jgi:hypothetical protein